jgi:hypothetical protein
MEQMIDKLAALEQDIASQKGEFSLFALFLREDITDKWDLVASAPWLETNEKAGLEFLVNQIRSRLDTQELLSLSRIVLLEKDNPVLEAVHRAMRVRHGRVQVQDSEFFGLLIKHAYVITSQRETSTENPAPQPA